MSQIGQHEIFSGSTNSSADRCGRQISSSKVNHTGFEARGSDQNRTGPKRAQRQSQQRPNPNLYIPWESSVNFYVWIDILVGLCCCFGIWYTTLKNMGPQALISLINAVYYLACRLDSATPSTIGKIPPKNIGFRWLPFFFTFCPNCWKSILS